MQYRPLGNSDINASVIGLGAWVMGGGAFWGKDPDDSESIATIHAALDAGINLIDTAPAYGFGRSEEVCGKAIKGRRDKVVLATKCGLWWKDKRGAHFFDMDNRPLHRSLRPDTLTIELENSLRRLDIDCIDLYQTHWPSMEPDKTPIADSMAALMKFKDQGKIRAIGVSNVTVDELQENCLCGPVVSDQLRYSMLARDAEKEILPHCLKNNIATLTYMSLEQGLLAGKVGMDRQFAAGEFRTNTDWNPWYAMENRRRVLGLLDKLKPFAEKYRCTLAQLVLAWTAAQPGVTHVLAGARRPAQIQETALAGTIEIVADDLARIRAEVVALGEPAPTV